MNRLYICVCLCVCARWSRDGSEIWGDKYTKMTTWHGVRHRHVIHSIPLFACIIPTFHLLLSSVAVKIQFSSQSEYKLRIKLTVQAHAGQHAMAVYVQMVMIIKASTCLFWWPINRCWRFHLIHTGLVVVTAGYMALWQVLIWCLRHHHHRHHLLLLLHHHPLDLKVSEDMSRVIRVF